MIEKVSKKTTITKIIRNAIKRWFFNCGLAIVKIIVCTYFVISIMGPVLLLLNKSGVIKIEHCLPDIIYYAGPIILIIYIVFKFCCAFYMWTRWRTHLPLTKEELHKLHIYTREDLLIFLNAYGTIKVPFQKRYVSIYCDNEKADYYQELNNLLRELPSYAIKPYGPIKDLSYSGKIEMITKELAEDIRQYYKSLECDDLVGFIDGLIKIEHPELFIEERKKIMEEQYANNN